MPNRYNAIFLIGVLTLIFLLFPATKKSRRDRIVWYDVLAIVVSLAANGYIAINAESLAFFGRISANPLEIVLGLAVIVTIAEAVRRTVGWSMVIIAVAFLLFDKFGYLIPGNFSVPKYSLAVMMSDVYLSSEGIYGSLMTVASTIIIAFITFGTFFIAAGGGKFFADLALSFAGGTRGGPAKAAVVGSALFGTISQAAPLPMRL